MRGFTVPACFIAFIILPGIALTYVFLCPLISASSLTPPRDILTYFLLSAFAIDLAIDVLPTPGGPTKQRIVEFVSSVFILTARYSVIRSLTFFRP
ncbi:hypothetical protein SDC9_110008 [bioreactor metagenome]|uniref:Uncharacterized protein n=1 Tax=bioreactor metagenome TaxID=1076179 RepID=A0A645BDJ9_9ZZZZ